MKEKLNGGFIEFTLFKVIRVVILVIAFWHNIGLIGELYRWLFFLEKEIYCVVANTYRLGVRRTGLKFGHVWSTYCSLSILWDILFVVFN